MDFPQVIRGYRDEYEQPSTVAHCDWSRNGAITVLRWCFPVNEDYWEGKKFDMLKYARTFVWAIFDFPVLIAILLAVFGDP